MFPVFECVAQAIKEKGVRGLCEMVPAGPYIFDVANHAYKLFCERRRDQILRDELAKIAASSVEEVRRVAAQVARQVAREAPIEEQISLELYLTQIPGAARRSLKRAEDPSGKTVPPDLVLAGPEAFARLLPQRMPQFRTGEELPGRSGWRLDELLGSGGFGEVWLTRHALIPHPRAVKFCTDEKARGKLASHEGRVIARVMAQGSHPNVVPLLDAVLDGDTPWLMYEYVAGGSLTDLLLKWQFLSDGERESVALLSLGQLASAVGTFHRLGPPIVHRDLKPANILIDSTTVGRTVEPPGSVDPCLSFRLRITDFGIGGAAGVSPHTNPGGVSQITGWLEPSLRGSYTPLYASPQQSRGAPPDPRDDVHALGVIGYQMLTGKLTEAPSPRFERDLRSRGVAAALIELIGDCVDTEVHARPKDAAELAERLSGLRAKQTTLPARSTAGTGGNARLASPGVFDLGSDRKAPDPVFATKGPLEGGSSATGFLPFAEPLEATTWRLPVRGVWFNRPADAPDSQWAQAGMTLPGAVVVRRDEVYRLALDPETTGDAELAELKTLLGLPGLEAIDLSGCRRVTDVGLMHLAHLRGLQAVGLADTQVTDSGVMLLLTRFPNLESVELSRTEYVSPAVIPALLRMRKLKFLALPPRADTIDVRAEFTKRRPGCRLA